MSNDDPPRRSLLKWLDLIQLRPGMYLGVSPPHYARMLDRLEGFVLGYHQAVDVHTVPDPGVELYFEFSRYLEKRLGIRTAAGVVVPAVREASPSDAEAWKAFWNFLAEFRNIQKPG